MVTTQGVVPVVQRERRGAQHPLSADRAIAYRMALDHPDQVDGVAALDVVPIDAAWDLADDRLAIAFWPWSLLAQPSPLPERLIGSAADVVIDTALSVAWGTPAETFSPDVRARYLAQLQDPEHLHAICEEYRAAAGIDRDHDAHDRTAGHQIRCPTLVLWSSAGPLATWYEPAGGPLRLWREIAPLAVGRAVDGGHFFPEQRPHDTASALTAFFSQLVV